LAEIDEAETAFQTIGQRAVQSNLARVARLDEAIAAARKRGLDDYSRSAAAALAHQIVGSAGTFGFVEATAPARELERLLTVEQLTQGALDRAGQRLAEIREVLMAQPGADDSPPAAP
jgi:HPt (histidine-containing phosphotransfer) domain-containing protein